MSQKRLTWPNGTPLNEGEVAELLKAHPDMVGKINKYGYNEAPFYENFWNGLKRGGYEDFAETGDYLYNLAREQTPKYKGSGEADAVGAQNVARETEYQQQTDGSFWAGLGRAAPLAVPVGGVAKGVATAVGKAATRIPAIRNSAATQKLSTALSNFSAKKAAEAAAAPAAAAAANKAVPEIGLLVDGYKGLKNATVNNPRWYVNAPARGALGYTMTNAKDKESASWEHILGYGAGGGAIAGGLGKALGPPLKGAGDRLRKEFEDVRKGFNIPPSSMAHAPIGRVLEVLAGKNHLATELAIKNTQNAHKLARQEIGLPPSTNPLTDVDFNTAKQQPSEIYDSVRGLKDPRGNPLKVSIDQKAQRSLFNSLSADKRRTASVDAGLFRVLENSYRDPKVIVPDLIDDIRQWGDEIKVFKNAGDNSSARYMSAHKKNAENSLAQALEKEAPGKYNEYLDARKKFAKIHALEESLSGEKLNAIKLAAQRVKSGSDKLPGGIKDITDFARRHPKVAFSAADSVDMPWARQSLFSAGGALAGGPWGAAAGALAPPMAREILGSRFYQNAATSPSLNKLGSGLNHLLDYELMPGYWGATRERSTKNPSKPTGMQSPTPNSRSYGRPR